MLQLIAIVRAVIVLLPLLSELIQAVEAAMPGAGQGSSKLAMVQVMLSKAFGQAQGAEATFEQVWPILSPAISGLVTMFNRSGTFASTPVPVITPVIAPVAVADPRQADIFGPSVGETTLGG